METLSLVPFASHCQRKPFSYMPMLGSSGSKQRSSAFSPASGGRHIFPLACALFTSVMGQWRAAGIRRMIEQHPEAERVWAPMVYWVQLVAVTVGVCTAWSCRFLQDAAVPPRPTHNRRQDRRRARSASLLRHLLEMPVSEEV